MEPSDPVTQEEFLKFRKAVIKKLKFLDEQVSLCFVQVSDVQANDVENNDEAIDRAGRAERSVRRLKKEVDALRKEYDDHEH